MILKKIYISLINIGFNSIGINRDNINLFQYVQGEKIYIVAIYDCPSGLEYTSQQLANIDKQIINYYYSKGYSNIKLLGIISTSNSANIKELATTNDNFWVVDTHSFQLIIYENQDDKFLSVKEQIEDILKEVKSNNIEEEEIELSQSYPNYVSAKSTKSIISQYMTKWNTTIIIANILIYIIIGIISRYKGDERLVWLGAIYWPTIVYSNEFYRLLTYMFLHSNISHLANNMLVLFFLGDNLERAVGKWRFLLMYFGSGIIAGIVSMSYNMFNEFNVISIGASGAIFGVVGAMVNIIIRNKGRLENISTRQMVLFVVFSLYGGLTSQGIDNAAHIGGLISGFLIAAVIYRTPKKKNNYVRGV